MRLSGDPRHAEALEVLHLVHRTGRAASREAALSDVTTKIMLSRGTWGATFVDTTT